MAQDAVSDIERNARRGIVGLGRDLIESMVDGWPSRDDEVDPSDRGMKVNLHQGRWNTLPLAAVVPSGE